MHMCVYTVVHCESRLVFPPQLLIRALGQLVGFGKGGMGKGVGGGCHTLILVFLCRIGLKSAIRREGRPQCWSTVDIRLSFSL